MSTVDVFPSQRRLDIGCSEPNRCKVLVGTGIGYAVRRVMPTLGGEGRGGICGACPVEGFCEKGGVLVGNGHFGRLSASRVQVRPTTHAPDRTAPRFWTAKVLVLRFGG
jgi:hypothetical protein